MQGAVQLIEVFSRETAGAQNVNQPQLSQGRWNTSRWQTCLSVLKGEQAEQVKDSKQAGTAYIQCRQS